MSASFADLVAAHRARMAEIEAAHAAEHAAFVKRIDAGIATLDAMIKLQRLQTATASL